MTKEEKVRRIAAEIYAHGFDDAKAGLTLDEIDENHRTEADKHIDKLMRLITIR